ncbi:MAG: hypothetical protein J2P45_01220 [Candidatus Dormibacteraeota bacterium]|nr:hypothetical protein [Candidatus Dormibacteraeota bacterium]
MFFIPLFAGLGTGVGEWFLVALILYAAVAMMRRSRRRPWYGYQAEPVPRMVTPASRAPHDPNGVRQLLPRISAMTSGRLPVGYQTKVNDILRRVDHLMQQTDRMGSEDLYLVRQTAVDYLPTTLNAYLALPRGYAYQLPEVGRKPALHVLWEQLCMLEAKLVEVERGIDRRDADSLLANGRFLQNRLSPPTAGLDPKDQDPT